MTPTHPPVSLAPPLPEEFRPHPSPGLVELLDHLLDKGAVVAGDISVSLAGVELLTLRLRLLVCSVDKAEEIGMDWWNRDPSWLPRSQQPQLTSTVKVRRLRKNRR